MRYIGLIIGRTTFWLTLPMLRVYLRLQQRTRVLVRHGEHVLVVRPWLSAGKWILPGGGIHRNEAPVAAALREVREETGVVLAAEQLQYGGQHLAHEEAGLRFVYHLFIVDVTEGMSLVAQRYEISDVAWVHHTALLHPGMASKLTRSILQDTSKT